MLGTLVALADGLSAEPVRDAAGELVGWQLTLTIPVDGAPDLADTGEHTGTTPPPHSQPPP